MTYSQVLNWMIGFIDIVSIQHITTITYTALSISTLYSSLLHALVSQSTLSATLSWQRIHNSLTVTSNLLCTA
jgi:hypothetical protein